MIEWGRSSRIRSLRLLEATPPMYVSSRQPDRVRYGNSLLTWDHAIRRGTIAAMKKNSNKRRPASAKSPENRLAEASTADDGLREPNLPRALNLVMELMAIAGRSGEEQQIASAICHHLRDAGLPESAITHDSAHRRTRLPGEVGNLIVKLPGTRRAPPTPLIGMEDRPYKLLVGLACVWRPAKCPEYPRNAARFETVSSFRCY